MNPALKDIFSRRSIRRYKKRQITDRMIKDLLEAAMAAPSAVETDPWRFIVVKNPKTLAKIADGLPYGKMLKGAPLGLVVCGDIEKANAKLESYMLQDCCAAIENILLAANMLGLGACWLGVHPREKRIAHISELFALPAHIIPVCAIAVGWPAEKFKPRTRYDYSAVHWEKW